MTSFDALVIVRIAALAGYFAFSRSGHGHRGASPLNNQRSLITVAHSQQAWIGRLLCEELSLG